MQLYFFFPIYSIFLLKKINESKINTKAKLDPRVVGADPEKKSHSCPESNFKTDDIILLIEYPKIEEKGIFLEI